jgi:hypothetical protein
MNPTSSLSPLSPKELVDEYFIENRTKLLEIAAFLDRLDRADPSYAARDFRMRAFAEALAGLGEVPAGRAGAPASSGKMGSRVDYIQQLLSDPREVPLDALDRKSALGAYDRWSEETRS